MGLFDIFRGKKEEAKFDGEIYSPINGKILPIEEVPDPVFAEKLAGDGIAVDPISSGVIVAPIDGKLEKLFETNHAFVVTSNSGIEVLVHFGVDTVKLEGKGFKRLVEEGATVTKGTPLVEYDYEYLKENAASVITSVIISNYDEFGEIDKFSGDAKAAETVIMNINKK